MRKVMVLVCVGLLVLCAVLVYGIVDRSVSLDHAQVEQRRLEEERALLQKLLLDFAVGTPKSEVLELLKRKHASRIFKEEGDTILVDDVVLKFQNGKLIDVLSLSDAKAGS